MTIRYSLDSARSRFTVQAFATGVLSGFAHNPVFAVRDFSGEMRFDPETLAEAVLEINVRADSLELTDNVKDADRLEIVRAMREDVLQSSKYPQITFRSTEIAITKIADNWLRAQIQGDLTLHGVTRPQSIDAQLRLLDGELRLSGELMLLQSAFKVKRVSALAGMIKVKDELKFSFDLVGIEQK